MILSMVKLEGKLKVLDGDMPMFREFKDGLSEGQVVEVEFTKEAKSASSQQSKYFHLLRDRYAKGLGYDKERAKDELCVLFGVSIEISEAIKQKPKWAGHIVELWDKEHVRKSTREYTRDEWGALIEGTIMACVENDVPVEDLVGDYRRAMQDANDAA